MLKVDKDTLDQIEKRYPGLGETILHYERAKLPACAHCGSEDTAAVGGGLVGRSIAVASATTKFKLVPNNRPGKQFCNSCNEFFN